MLQLALNAVVRVRAGRLVVAAGPAAADGSDRAAAERAAAAARAEKEELLLLLAQRTLSRIFGAFLRLRAAEDAATRARALANMRWGDLRFFEDMSDALERDLVSAVAGTGPGRDGMVSYARRQANAMLNDLTGAEEKFEKAKGDEAAAWGVVYETLNELRAERWVWALVFGTRIREIQAWLADS